MSSAAAAMMKNPVSGSLGALMRETHPNELKGIGDYEFGHVIGEGQFGTVRKARHLTSNRTVAVKIISKRKLVPQTVRMIQREVAIMKMLRHPNIIRLYEVIDTEEFLFLIMEHASGGEMMDIILSHGRLKEAEARKYFAQAAYALAYCHSHHTVHRDVKAENMLLDDNMNVKLIDFGFSNTYDPTNVLQTFCGSPTYASPELVQRHAYTGPEVDCWSLGVLLYVLVAGELPFTGETYLELYQKIVSASFKMPSYLTPACKDLILNMLQPDIPNRLNIVQICNHPWVLAGHLPVPPENFTTMQTSLKEEDLNRDVLDYMESLGFDREAVVRSVVDAKYDDAAATYYLMLEASPKPKSIKAGTAHSSSESLSPTDIKASPGAPSDSSEVSSHSTGSSSDKDKKEKKLSQSKREGKEKKKKDRKTAKAEKRRSNSLKLSMLRDPANELTEVEGTPVITTVVKDEEVESPKEKKSSKKVPPKLLAVKRLQDDSKRGPSSPPSSSDESSQTHSGFVPSGKSDEFVLEPKKRADSGTPSRVAATCSSESSSSRVSSVTGDEHDGSGKIGGSQRIPGKSSSKSPGTKKQLKTPYAGEPGASSRNRCDEIKGTRSTPSSPITGPSVVEHTAPPLVEMESKVYDEDDKGSSRKHKHRHHHHRHDSQTPKGTPPEGGEIEETTKLMASEGDDADDSDMTRSGNGSQPKRKRSSSFGSGHNQGTVGLRSKECLGFSNTEASLTEADKVEDERQTSADIETFSSSSDTEISSTEISPVTEQSSIMYSSNEECVSEPRSLQTKRCGDSPRILLTPKTPKTPKSPLSKSRETSPLSPTKARTVARTHSPTMCRELRRSNTANPKKGNTVLVHTRPSESTNVSRTQSPGDIEQPVTPESKDHSQKKMTRRISYSTTQEAKKKRPHKSDKQSKDTKMYSTVAGEVSDPQPKKKSDKKNKTLGAISTDGKEGEESESRETEEEEEIEPGSPRSVRFAISLKTVCELEPDEIMKRIEEGLKTLGPTVSSKKETPSMYRVLCRERKVVLEVEVCRLLFLPVHGIKFHRVSGDAWKYSSLCKEITAAVNLE